MPGLSERIEREPEYRPYCLNCSTMQRMTLDQKDGRRIMRCEIAAETHHGAAYLTVAFGIPPRVGCGIQFDIETGERV